MPPPEWPRCLAARRLAPRRRSHPRQQGRPAPPPLGWQPGAVPARKKAWRPRDSKAQWSSRQIQQKETRAPQAAEPPGWAQRAPPRWLDQGRQCPRQAHRPHPGPLSCGRGGQQAARAAAPRRWPGRSALRVESRPERKLEVDPTHARRPEVARQAPGAGGHRSGIRRAAAQQAQPPANGPMHQKLPCIGRNGPTLRRCATGPPPP